MTNPLQAAIARKMGKKLPVRDDNLKRIHVRDDNEKVPSHVKEAFKAIKGKKLGGGIVGSIYKEYKKDGRDY